MTKQKNGLLKEVGYNALISAALFALLIGGLFLLGKLPKADNMLLLSISSSFLGVAYILTVRNPQNFWGFLLGACSSILLGLQFLAMPDLTILYFCVFIPAQIFSIYIWVKGGSRSSEPFNPALLSPKNLLYTIALFFSLLLIDLYLAYQFLDPIPMIARIVNGIFIASAVVANLLLIFKYTESWFFWVLFSVAGVGVAILTANSFTFLLFIVFLIINCITFQAWVKAMPRENYGWAKRFIK